MVSDWVTLKGIAISSMDFAHPKIHARREFWAFSPSFLRTHDRIVDSGTSDSQGLRRAAQHPSLVVSSLLLDAGEGNASDILPGVNARGF